MSDLIFVAILLAFFGLAALLVSACARIVDPDLAEQPSIAAPVVEIEDLAA